jgi:Trk K+ transport system NAD-binding subunit
MLVEIRKGDILVVDAAPEDMDKFVGELKLDYSSKGKDSSPLSNEDMSLWEAVVPDGARIEGRTAQSLQLQYRHGVTLLGVSRQGKQFRERVRHLALT